MRLCAIGGLDEGEAACPTAITLAVAIASTAESATAALMVRSLTSPGSSFEALEPLIDYYKRFPGENPDWDEYRERMRREQRVLIRITLERAGPDRQG